MANFACDTHGKRGIKRAGPQALEAPTVPNQSPIIGGSRMADYSPYNNRNCGDSPEKSANWKSIGELAAELVRKAGAQ